MAFAFLPMLSTHRIDRPRARSPRMVAGLLGLFLVVLGLGSVSRGQSVTNLGGFSVAQGAFPTGLVQASDGNFYGTSATGAGTGGGSVFQMTPQGLVSILYVFGGFPLDTEGTNPTCGLIQASDGKLYGTTSGGTYCQGTVFSITTTGTVNFLHDFASGPGSSTDGTAPMGSLVQGTDGNLYGTTSAGGTAGKGTIFQVALNGTYATIHNFGDGSVANDAAAPTVGLVQDAQGNFYGTSFHGGAYNQGAVYKIDTQKRLSILYSFSQSSVVSFGGAASKSGGCYPNSKLLLGADGNLYGTTAAVPGYGFGTLYSITPTGVETVLHYFGDGSVTNDGQQPSAPIEGGENLLVQSSGNGTIYGTTSAGGGNGKGVLFALTTAGVVSIVHSFGDSTVANDGTVPLSGVIFGSDGNIYGTTGEGGTTGWTPNTVAATNAVTPTAGTSGSTSSTGATTDSTTTTASGSTLTITQSSGTSTTGGFITIALGSGTVSGTTYSGGGAISVNPGTFTLSGTAYVGTLFKIQPAIPAFTNSMAITGAVGVPLSYQVSTTQPVPQILSSSLPQGLSIDVTTGLITGTPVAAGVTNVTVYSFVPNTTPTVTITGSLLITIWPPPLITSVLSEFGSTSAPFYYQITTNQGSTAFGAAGLPTGLSVDPATGIISGTPTETGTFPVVLSSTNIAGFTSSTLNLVITATAPVLSQAYVPIHNFQDGTINGEGRYPVSTTNGPASTLIAITSSGTGLLSTQVDLAPAGTGSVFNAIGGSTPSSFILGFDGNYYGVTPAGGNAGLGSFVQVTPAGVMTVLHSFGDGSVTNDGTNPVGAIYQGSNGNFYGVTKLGGANSLGTIYTVKTDGTISILYSFVAADGIPSSGVVLGPDAAFYGTTLTGGSAAGGTVYRYSGTKTVLHSFGAVTNDGQIPSSELVFHDGNIYGTTNIGGTLGKGTAYELTTAGVETVLHNFSDGSVTGDGINPLGSIVVVDRATTGVTIFGTTQNGGADGEGSIYELDASGAVTILHNFDDPNWTNDGLTPMGGLCLGADGNLYGTTLAGGLGSGTFFAVVANLNPAPTPAPVWTFSGNLPTGLTFNTATGTISGTPLSGTLGGLYKVSITSPTNVTTTTTYALPQSFSQWSMAKTGTNLVTNAPSPDGVPNALKYLYDISPTGSLTSADRAALPAFGIDETSVPGTPYASLSFRENATMTGMTVTLESSDDMVTWTPVPAGVLISKQSGIDPATGDPMMEMAAPRDDSPQQFLRLQVTAP